MFPRRRLNGQRGAGSPVLSGASSASASLLQHPTPTPCASRQRGGIWGIAHSPGKGLPPAFLAQTSTYCNSSAFGNFAPHQQTPPGNFEKKNKGAKNKEPGRGRKGREGRGSSPLSGQAGDPPLAAPGSALPARRLLSGAAPGWPWAPHPGSEPPHRPCQGLLGVCLCSCRALSDGISGGSCPAAPAHGGAFPAAQRYPSQGPLRASSAASPAGDPFPRRATGVHPTAAVPEPGPLREAAREAFRDSLETASKKPMEIRLPFRCGSPAPLAATLNFCQSIAVRPFSDGPLPSHPSYRERPSASVLLPLLSAKQP